MLLSIKKNVKSIFTRPGDNLAVLDGLRAISILWIFLFHVYVLIALAFSAEAAQQLLRDTPWFFNWIWNGDKGVEIFFVISGFLISGLLFREYSETQRLDLKSFYVRRFLRLTPVYWFALILYFLLGGPNSHTIWANFLYINNFLPTTEMAMTWTWTLAVEEQFYLLAPVFLLLVFFKSEHKIAWLLGFIFLSLLVRYLLLVTEPDLYHSKITEIFNLDKSDKFNLYFDRMYVNLYSRFGPFICGIFASYLYFYHETKVRQFFAKPFAMVLTLLSSLLLLLMVLAPSYHQGIDYLKWYEVAYIVGNRTLYSVALSVVILASLCSKDWCAVAARWFLSLRIWLPFAHLSYSIYIIHIVVVGWVHFNLKATLKARGDSLEALDFYQVMMLFPISLIVASLIAALFYVFIEKPFMNMRKGFRPKLVQQQGKTEAV